MTDLRSRWNVLLLVVALMPMFGCMILDASPHTSRTSGLEAGKPTMNFGAVVLGDYTVVNDMLENSSDQNITISLATVSGAGFEITEPAFPVTLTPRQQLPLSVTFTPAAAGEFSGSIVLTNNGPTPSLTLKLSASAVIPGFLAANPTKINFGTVAVGKSVTQQETFSNPGGTNLTITQANASQNNFKISGLPLPIMLKPNQTATFSVTFTPLTSGPSNGNISMNTRAAGWAHGRRGQYHRAVPLPGANVSMAPTARGEDDDLTIPLSGMASSPSQLSATPSISFSSTPVGKSQGLSDTLTNTGTSSITVSQVTATGTGFSVTGLSLPLTIAAGQSTSFTVVFSPQTAGSATGNIAITSNASNSNVNTTLTGTAAAVGALTASPSSLSFGSVQVSKTQTSTETVTNSGGSSVTISQASATGAGFSVSGINLPLTLAAGASTSFSVTFAPQTSGAVTGGVTVTSNASNSSLGVALSGTGISAGALTASPSSLSFGSVQVSKTQTSTETLTNSGGSSVTISQASASGAGFSVSGINLPLTLAAGASTSFSVTFAPQTSGAVTGGLTVTSDASNASLGVALSGTGVTAGSLTASPSSMSFGNVQVSQSQTVTETLTNSGGSSVTISQATATGSGFSVSGITLPITLAAGQSTSFSVAFAPQASGAVTGGISVTSTASNTSLAIGLSGTGVTAGSLTASPSSVSFGNIQISKNQTVTETLTNSGGSSVTISQASATGTGFSVSGITLPLTLAAGQATSFSVAFAPQTNGAASGNLVITSTASNSTLNIGLSGSGVTAGSLIASPTSVSFGNVQTSKSQTATETLTNSGGSAVTITQATATGAGFSVSGITLPLTIAAGQTTSFSVAFAPQNSGAATGSLTITSNASNATLSVGLSGTGVAPGTLAATLTSLSFGSVQTGHSAALSETVTNSGGSSVSISQVNVTGTGFSAPGLDLPVTLSAGQSFTFSAIFAPQAAGAATGSISVVSNASNTTLAISLSGTGTAAGQLAVSPTTLSFGNVNVGSSKSLTGTLAASGASVTITSESSSTTEFVISGVSFPLTIAAGQSASFTMTFTPQAGGAALATASFASNASNTPGVQSLTGTGVAPVQHQVALTWNASTSSVVGYNIYRGLATAGPFSKINSTPETDNNYTDATVQSGKSYFYLTTAVDSNGMESGYSNEVAATIPTP